MKDFIDIFFCNPIGLFISAGVLVMFVITVALWIKLFRERKK